MKIVVETFTYFTEKIFVCVADKIEVQSLYEQQKKANKNTEFPYWAKLWLSSIALANFIEKNPALICNTNVLELAGGLGLPSLVAAKIAAKVMYSDYLPEPIHFVEKAIEINKYNNVFCSIINWNNIPKNVTTDVLLLSDINYEPAAFVNLNLMLQQFLQQGTTIILATPQRLMAKQFVENMLPFCVQHQEDMVEGTAVSIFVLKLIKDE